MAVPISQAFSGQNEQFNAFKEALSFGIHCCLPCIVQSFDSSRMTVDAQPTVRERIIQESGQITYMQYPLLINVPVVFPQGGGNYITFPVSPGDECLVIFSDNAIDNWWVSGGIQNPVEQRRHDLSDGFAIVGVRSISKSMPSVGSGVKIKGPGSPEVNVNGENATIESGNASVTVTSNGVTVSMGNINIVVNGLNVSVTAGSSELVIQNGNIHGNAGGAGAISISAGDVALTGSQGTVTANQIYSFMLGG